LTVFLNFLNSSDKGSITCIICLTCVGSQLSINSSSARSFSGPVQLCDADRKRTGLKTSIFISYGGGSVGRRLENLAQALHL
uniref:Uncharacterized protein n=1 Tax=Oryzias sinensis TaxID=183150 RepID=A0A8C7Y3Z4_9TELE